MGRIAGQKEGFVTEGGHGYPLLGQVPLVTVFSKQQIIKKNSGGQFTSIGALTEA